MLAAIPIPTLVTAVGFHFLAVSLMAVGLVICRRPRLWLHLFALYWGLLVGFIDMQAHSVQLPVLMLLSGGLFFGFAGPQRPWRWAVITGIWVPISGVIQTILEIGDQMVSAHPGLVLVPLIPAFVGAYAGAFAAREVARAQAGDVLSGRLHVEEK